VSDWPDRWIAATGSDVFEMVTSGSRGWAKHYAESGAAFIRVGNLDHDTIRLDLRNIQRVAPPSGAEGERTRLQAHDLLVSITAEVGMVGLVPDGLGEAYINQHIALARPLPGFDPRFVAWYMASEADGKRRLREVSRGGTKSGLGLEDIRDVSIPLAPLAEQQRIADKLDTVLARVDACRDRLSRVAPLLKRFRQSVLAAATSGRLTEDWAPDSIKRMPWRQVKLEEVAEDFSYGSAAKSSKAGSIPVLRMGNIQDGRLDWSALVFTSDPIEIDKYALRAGDVLFNRTNSPELVGKTAVFAGERQAIYAGYLIRVRCSSQVLPDYLNYCLGSPAGRAFCWSAKSDGVSQSNINATKLKAFVLGLPPVEEQVEIIRRVETLFAFADRLEARLAQTQTAIDRLTPSLLAKAFRGELVPQDPADEPAADLLKRLAAQQEAEPARPRRKRATA
jgi:type I restriction enzyme S subunit